MSLTKKFFDWVEKRSLDVAYGVNLDKEPFEPFSEVFIDIFAMGVTLPQLLYKKYFIQNSTLSVFK